QGRLLRRRDDRSGFPGPRPADRAARPPHRRRPGRRRRLRVQRRGVPVPEPPQHGARGRARAVRARAVDGAFVGASSAPPRGSRDRAGQEQGWSMVASDGFAEFLREQLAPLGHVTMRRMFGKTGVFCDGLMLGMVRDDALYFRVDDHNRVAFKEAQSFPPLNYEKKGSSIDLAFWRAPERLFDEPDELVAWARAALAAARRVAVARERTAPRRRSKPRPT